MSTVAADEELESLIARTALKYDLLPYQSKPFAQSQPSRLAAIAKLFALETAPLENARILELGCASGGNIIPHAALYPKAKFVGVDLARTQVAAGRARIKKLGLKNIEIHCQSITEIDDDLGQFDYIICHGVFSWVPEQVKDAILQVTRDRLSPVGVACISYNVLPGWRMLQPLRDAFLLQIPDHVDSLARVAKARELLTFMKSATPDKGPYGDMVKAWADRLVNLPDDYIAHEFLEETNAPNTVRDFTASAARHDLGYLGECELSTMILENYGADVANQVRARSGNDLIESEQFLDLLSGRTFRQSLLVGSERMAHVNRALSPERLVDLHFLTLAGMKIERDGDKGIITDSQGRTLNTDQKAVVDGLEKMIARFPASSTIDDAAKGLPKGGREQLLDALYRMLLVGMIQIVSEPVLTMPDVSKKPKATALSQADAQSDAEFTTNARHETVSMDAVAKVVLPKLDGKTDLAGITTHVMAAIKAGKIHYSRDGKPITDQKDLKEVVEGHLPNLLNGIAVAGLLEA